MWYRRTKLKEDALLGTKATIQKIHYSRRIRRQERKTWITCSKSGVECLASAVLGRLGVVFLPPGTLPLPIMPRGACFFFEFERDCLRLMNDQDLEGIQTEFLSPQCSGCVSLCQE